LYILQLLFNQSGDKMPQHKSSVKRVRQSEKRRIQNREKRSMMKTVIKKVRTASDKESAKTELQNAISVLDRMAVKGLIHKNKAANIKSKLTKKVDAM
jgi:small subunit ribosomal protein S20